MRRLAVVGILVAACAKDPEPKVVTVDPPASVGSVGTGAPSAASGAPGTASGAAPGAPGAAGGAPGVASAAPSATSVGSAEALHIVWPAGPKGDGTCVAHAMAGCTSPPCTRVLVPVPCPAIPTAKSTDEELGRSACDWSAACDRMGDEGCCVGCNNPFRVKLSRACALQIVAKKDCKSVQATWDACAGR